jgi:uncharacterized iron-regulated protein
MRIHPFSMITAACGLAATLALFGCVGSPAPLKRPLASVQGTEARFHRGQIVHLPSGSALTFTQFIDGIASRDAVFIGEVHDNPDHHLIQVQILQALMERHGRVTAAMEFFQAHQQGVVDAYVRGLTDEDQFLKDVDWNGTWGFDYRLYRPILLLLRQGKCEALALNAPSGLVKKVARSGLESLDPEERGRLAARIRLDHPGHREYVMESFKAHTHPELKVFEHFYQAQCSWEDTMAENLADYLKTHREKVVVLSGNGHIVYRFGIPERTLDRVQVSVATVLLHPLGEAVALSPDMADYVWLTADCRSRHPGSIPLPMPPAPVAGDRKAHALDGSGIAVQPGETTS